MAIVLAPVTGASSVTRIAVQIAVKTIETRWIGRREFLIIFLMRTADVVRCSARGNPRIEGSEYGTIV